MSRIQRVVFVWNADFSFSGGVRAVQELMAGEHTCTLCTIAYHRVRQTADWKSYKQSLRERLQAQVREPCRNQLSAAERAATADQYPSVLAHLENGVVQLLDRSEIDACDGAFDCFRKKLDRAIDARVADA